MALERERKVRTKLRKQTPFHIEILCSSSSMRESFLWATVDHDVQYHLSSRRYWTSISVSVSFSFSLWQLPCSLFKSKLQNWAQSHSEIFLLKMEFKNDVRPYVTLFIVVIIHSNNLANASTNSKMTGELLSSDYKDNFSLSLFHWPFFFIFLMTFSILLRG
jgi:hypothetical protein